MNTSLAKPLLLISKSASASNPWLDHLLTDETNDGLTFSGDLVEVVTLNDGFLKTKLQGGGRLCHRSLHLNKQNDTAQFKLDTDHAIKQPINEIVSPLTIYDKDKLNPSTPTIEILPANQISTTFVNTIHENHILKNKIK